MIMWGCHTYSVTTKKAHANGSVINIFSWLDVWVERCWFNCINEYLMKELVIEIKEGPKGVCDLCHTFGQELRPYGPNGENICFDCSMENEGITSKMFEKVVFGDVKVAQWYK